MKRKVTYILSGILALLVFMPGIQAQELDKKIKSLDSYYEKALEDWKSTGLAIAFVKDGEIIFSKGYGIQSVDTKKKVNKETLFAVASNSKAFTSASLAILVDQGKVNWDDKVQQYLPWFELYDPYVSAEMTIRDLLCHRSGLKTFSGDLIWYGTNHSREEVVRRARHLEPVYGFRSHFGYSNILYLTAGLVVEEVSGMTWDAFIDKHFFEPLEMNRTISSTKDLESMKNVAAPHNEVDGEMIAIDYLNWDNIAPAGSIISSADDMAKWLILQLGQGIYKGDTIFTPARSEEMWASNTSMDISAWSKQMFPSTHFKSYGLGWSIYDLHGKKIVTHNGGYDGMLSQTVMIPEENMGFVLLSNSLSGIYYPLVVKTLEVLLSDLENDYSSMFLSYNLKGKEASKERAKNAEKERRKDTKPSLDLEAYTGTYGGEMYGDATIEIKDGKLYLHLLPTEIFQGSLRHWSFDTFEIKFPAVPSLPAGKVQFILDMEGNVEEMKIDVPNPDFDFTELKFKKK
jgi:CubicO group peptidase (beta-lactamase class C family)